MTHHNYDSFSLYCRANIKFQRAINQLDSCHYCGHHLVTFKIPNPYKVNFERVLQCHNCNSYWGITQARFTDISSLVGLKTGT